MANASMSNLDRMVKRLRIAITLAWVGWTGAAALSLLFGVGLMLSTSLFGFFAFPGLYLTVWVSSREHRAP